MYAAAHSGSGSHGVLISSKCLFLVRNSTPVSVDVSEAIPLVGGKLHLVAAIAWWTQRALSYPQPHIPAMGRAVPLPDSPLAKKLQRMDCAGSFAKYASFEGVAMQFLVKYRSGVVYRCSLDGRDTVVKTADPDKSWLVAELGNEVEAYKRLQDLQGICISWIFSTGHSVISGEDACFIPIEFLGNPPSTTVRILRNTTRMLFDVLDEKIKDPFFSILRLIHRRGVAHNDIRTANLLYAQTRPGGLQTPFINNFSFVGVGHATEEQKKKDIVPREALGGFE